MSGARPLDPDSKMARLYVLSTKPRMFGDGTLILEWGRIDTARQRRIELHKSPGSAMDALEMCLRRKQGRGYVTQPD